jgi:hypothetical protein
LVLPVLALCSCLVYVLNHFTCHLLVLDSVVYSVMYGMLVSLPAARPFHKKTFGGAVTGSHEAGMIVSSNAINNAGSGAEKAVGRMPSANSITYGSSSAITPGSGHSVPPPDSTPHYIQPAPPIQGRRSKDS